MAQTVACRVGLLERREVGVYSMEAQCKTFSVIDNNVRRALMVEIENWFQYKENKDSMDYKLMQYVQMLLGNGFSPWKYIKKTRETYFIDTCAYIAYRVLHSLPPEEKEYTKKWLTDEGFYDTVH